MRLPDFFLVGAPKAGTTSIYNYLSQHPEIFTPTVKEPHFFACPEVKNTYYEESFVDEIDDYLSLFSESSKGQKAGDFSTSYLHREKAARRIKNMCPDAHILIVLRDPVERAISHYLMDVRDGYQDNSLLDCISREGIDNECFYREYIDVGMYSGQVERYKNIFGDRRVKVLMFNDLVNETDKTLYEIEHHIDVDKNVNIKTDKNYNNYQRIKYEPIKTLLNSGFVKKISQNIPVRIREKMRGIVISKEKPELERARSELRRIFRDDVIRLQNIIDKDLSGWLR